MELLDRYLKLVKIFLPRAQQDDIIRELSEDIHSQMEEKEAELGRPLNRAEQKQLIGQLGHPALLAGRYGPRRQLIGPELFPFYWRVLTLALGANLLAQTIALGVSLASGRLVHPVLRVLSASFALFITFGVVTLVFAALGYFRPGGIFGRRWDPSRLDREMVVRDRRGSHPISRLVVGLIFVAWWIAARWSPALILGTGADVFRLGPVWDSAYPWIVTCGLAAIVRACADLIRPRRTHFHFAMRLIGSVGGLAVLLFLLSAGHFVVLADSAVPSARLDSALRAINVSVYCGLAWVAVVDVVTLLIELRAWSRGEGSYRTPHPGTPGFAHGKSSD